MSHFYGQVTGAARTTASRRGHKSTGLKTRAASWQGAVVSELYEVNGVDYVHVYMDTHQGAGSYKSLYRGPVGRYAPVDPDMEQVGFARERVAKERAADIRDASLRFQLNHANGEA